MCQINIDKGPGYGTGFVSATVHERLSQYLADFTDDAEQVVTWIRQRFCKIAVLENLRILDENRRGEGYGRCILDTFIAKAQTSGASAVILVVDGDEEQNTGFNLRAWYERAGFLPVFPGNCGPIMVLPLGSWPPMTVSPTIGAEVLA